MDPIRSALGAALAPHLETDADQIAQAFSVPPDPEKGDLALPTFRWAKAKKMAPPALAAQLAEAVADADLVARATTAGPYLNLFLDPGAAGALVLDPVLADPTQVGAAAANGQTVVIDYSSPNIAKPLHIGHLHTTVLGACLVRVLRHLGYTVVGVNHLGDWGTQFGRAAVAWDRWGSDEELAKAVEEGTGARYLVSLYVRFHDEMDKVREAEGLGKDEVTPLEVEARDWFRQLEEGDADKRALWEKFCEVSLGEAKRIYRRLGIEFEHYTGESFYIDQVEAAVARLQEAGILEESEGAEVVDVGEKIPFMVRKSDGATLYATRDLAACLYRLEEFSPAKVLYVVGAPQKQHFRLLFKAMAKLMPESEGTFVHVDYAHTRFKNRSMKTRSGDVVYLEDVLDEAKEASLAKVQQNIEEKGNYLDEPPEAVAEKVAQAALVLGYLKPDRAKEIIFDWDTAFELGGDTGGGVMYSHAQLRSILRKAGESGHAPNWSQLTEPEERVLVRMINDFGNVVAQVGKSYRPNTLVQHLLELRQLVNSYLRRPDLPKIKDLEDSPLKAARLGLVRASAEVLKVGLHLLGISAPDQM